MLGRPRVLLVSERRRPDFGVVGYMTLHQNTQSSCWFGPGLWISSCQACPKVFQDKSFSVATVCNGMGGKQAGAEIGSFSSAFELCSRLAVGGRVSALIIQ